MTLKKDLKRIKTTYTPTMLDMINDLQGEEWDNVPFSIKIEKLLAIAFAYQPYWEEDEVFKVIRGQGEISG